MVKLLLFEWYFSAPYMFSFKSIVLKMNMHVFCSAQQPGNLRGKDHFPPCMNYEILLQVLH